MKIYIYVLSLSYDLSMNRRRTSLFSLTFSRLLPYQPQGYEEAKNKIDKTAKCCKHLLYRIGKSEWICLDLKVRPPRLPSGLE